MTHLYAAGFIALALLASFYALKALDENAPAWVCIFAFAAAFMFLLATFTLFGTPKPIAFPSIQPHGSVAKGGR